MRGYWRGKEDAHGPGYFEHGETVGDYEFDVCEGLVCVAWFADEGEGHPVWGGVEGFPVEDYGFVRLGMLVEWLFKGGGFYLTSELRIPLKSGQMAPDPQLLGPRIFIISAAAAI